MGRDPESPPGPSAVASGPHRRDVEGLRAVAILAVVLYHAHVGWLGGGYVGVDVFFVVSGFLITGLLWRELERTGRVSFVSFYARRARRLLPASALVVVATIVASARWLPPLQVHDVVKDGAASSLYVANIRFALQSTNYLTSTAPPSPFQHFWSLAVEEQFYLVWPALMLGLVVVARPRSRHARRTARAPLVATIAGLGALAVASFLLSRWLTTANQPWAFFSLPTRAWELAAGGLVSLSAPWVRRLATPVAVGLGWSGVAVIAWSVTRLSASTAFPGVAALAPVLGTAAVIAAGTTGARSGPVALLGRGALQPIGKVSYSWYLWHWPVLIIAPAVVGHALTVWPNLGLVALSGGLAALTLVVVEDPVRWSPRLRAGPRATMVLGAGLTLTAVTACGLVAWSLPALAGPGQAPVAAQAQLAPLAGPGAARAVPAGSAGSADSAGSAGSVDPTVTAYSVAAAPVIAAVADSVAPPDVPANLEPPLGRAHADEARPFVDGCLDGYTETVVRTCAFGDTSSSTTVVLFGDSHAAQWFPAFDELATSRGWRLVVLTKATCPPVTISVFSPALGRTYRECDTWKANVVARIRAEHPVLVVLGVARHYSTLYHFSVYSPAWTQGLADMVTTIGQTGAAVAVMGAIPKPGTDVPDCLSAHLRDAAYCNYPLTAVYNPVGVQAEAAAVRAAGGSYIDTQAWFCTAATCDVMVDNLLVYRDDNHLTTSYAAWLAPVVGAALDEGALHPRPAPPVVAPA